MHIFIWCESRLVSSRCCVMYWKHLQESHWFMHWHIINSLLRIIVIINLDDKWTVQSYRNHIVKYDRGKSIRCLPFFCLSTLLLSPNELPFYGSCERFYHQRVYIDVLLGQWYAFIFLFFSGFILLTILFRFFLRAFLRNKSLLRILIEWAFRHRIVWLFFFPSLGFCIISKAADFYCINA